jgi:DNA (cytosine-5)-methyltransferase 1
VLLSLFCGAGGLDLGFERAGFDVGLAYDTRSDSVRSYNSNRHDSQIARCGDVRTLTVEMLDADFGSRFMPDGVIGGPPCQSFSRANATFDENDPRHELPLVYANLLASLNRRNPLKFFVMENVPGLSKDKRHSERFRQVIGAFENAGFKLFTKTLNAADYATPQTRHRLFIVGFNPDCVPEPSWVAPVKIGARSRFRSVESAIAHLPEPTFFRRDLSASEIKFHPNHWCMVPRSHKFTTVGALVPGVSTNRSFKTLAWHKPSLTVAYGHREVHIHPGCHRRLSVFEAMKLQGFPDEYVLSGTLSSQITQVSEAVPPPLAEAVAKSITRALVHRVPTGFLAEATHDSRFQNRQQGS